MKKHRNAVIFLFESVYGVLTPERREQASQTHQVYRTFRAKAKAERKAIEIFADNITAAFGSITVIILHIVFFGSWLSINTGKIPGIPPFDPPAFFLLTTIVSLEAIFLSLFVLVSQNREGQVNDLREEVDFQITMQAEQEITKLIHMMSEVHDHLGIKGKLDKELQAMKQSLDATKLVEEIRAEVKKA